MLQAFISVRVGGASQTLRARDNNLQVSTT